MLPATFDHATSVANLLTCMDQAQSLAAALAGDQWAVQSLCPDWDVKGVMAHLAAVESMLVGWMPSSADDKIPFGRAAEFANRAEDMPAPELVETMAELFDARRAEVRAMSAEQLEAPSATPVGPGTYGRFMAVRVFDFWVHQRDMAMPLGLATNDAGSCAEQALNEVHMSLGYIVGKKIGLEDGMSIAFRLDGPVEADLFAAVDGRAGIVESVDQPTVEVMTDSTTFVMLACGRIDPQEQIDAGRIRWSGDDEWGHRAASSLRFTM